MNTLILGTAIRLLVPVFQLFSLYILFRGHNHPGGGFIGGLIGSIGYIFYAMAFGPKSVVDMFFMRLYVEDRADTRSRSQQLLQTIKKNTWQRKKTLEQLKKGEKKGIHLEPMLLIATGLLLAAGSGLAGLLLQQPYMTALWTDVYLPILGKPGTPILFDLGVYLMVMGVVLKITFIMSEE
ncbi:MnhB domain-containing protein [Cesiribacter andamanensis]|uniref:Multiple resistance and pH homeostasis protein B n=1 Tax=Cesiribacter andamanensis AMV16 TaxID=1279009 RepID=M7NTP9_9BACT|nr:MnhB domain-containing protein [Cesiribacter andamanensis]EMR01839.1 Multiple resistance and pH homeostasis protein B [Cesiribacter andamanensis AMV16]